MTTTYAVLGATGNTGLALLQHLLPRPHTHVNAYVRSRSKLTRLLSSTPSESPNLTSHESPNPTLADAQNLTVHSGPLTSTPTLAQTLRNTHAAFLCVAVPGNVPNCTVAQDTARAVIAACEAIRAEDPGAKLPRLVVLSAAPVGAGNTNIFARILWTALSGLYEDLEKAETFLLSHSDLVDSTFVKPGALVVDIPRGYRVSRQEEHGPVLAYSDLAAAMVEVGDAEGGKWVGESVGVVALNGGGRVPWGNFMELVRGLVVHFWPGVYGWV